MSRPLIIAAGGGGDALGAMLATRFLRDGASRDPLHIATVAWERLRIDPTPGPRGIHGFVGLGHVGGVACEILPTSQTSPPGRSHLPRLAAESEARLFLLDLSGGATNLGIQIARLAGSLHCDSALVLDVGGDLIARGDEPTLKSPLCDALSAAGAVASGIPASAYVIGPGTDGELEADSVLARINELGARQVGTLRDSDVSDVERILEWHPTEATAITAEAARGLRGNVQIRAHGPIVRVNDPTPTVWHIKSRILSELPLVHAVRKTRTLAEAEAVMRSLAVNEIDAEREIATRNKRSAVPRADLDGAWHEFVAHAKAAGADFVTTRRIFEALGTPRENETAMKDRLRPLAKQHGGLWSLP